MKWDRLIMRLLMPFFMLVLLAGCSSDIDKEEIKTSSSDDRHYRGLGKFFGEDSISIGGERKKTDEEHGLGINSYLWRASLDTLSFMPISSADPFGGTILTDWYSPTGTHNERFKINVYILSRQLRSDGVRVSVFRQVRSKKGTWQDADVNPETERDLENAILKHARSFRSHH